MSDIVERLNRNAESWLPTQANTLEAHNLVGLAADRIEQLERVLAQALATLKDGDMNMVHATIAAIDEAMNA